MPLFGGGFLHDALLDLLRQMVVDGRSAFGGLVDRYILNPDGFITSGALVDDRMIVRPMYTVTSGIAIALLVLVLVYSSLRSMLERSMRAKYTLKVILPRILVVAALISVGLPLIGGAMDLNTAVAHTAWADPRVSMHGCIGQPVPVGTPGTVAHPDLVWCSLMGTGQGGDIVTAILFLILAVMLMILAFVGVVRNVTIAILTILAPIAFLCLILPETKVYTNMWRRFLVTAIFTQALQAVILRFALSLSFQQSTLAVLHGLVAMYLVLKVPSALHSASTAESKAMAHVRHLEHVTQMAIQHAIAPPHRVRAHPAD